MKLAKENFLKASLLDVVLCMPKYGRLCDTTDPARYEWLGKVERRRNKREEDFVC